MYTHFLLLCICVLFGGWVWRGDTDCFLWGLPHCLFGAVRGLGRGAARTAMAYRRRSRAAEAVRGAGGVHGLREGGGGYIDCFSIGSLI